MASCTPLSPAGPSRYSRVTGDAALPCRRRRRELSAALGCLLDDQQARAGGIGALAGARAGSPGPPSPPRPKACTEGDQRGLRLLTVDFANFPSIKRPRADLGCGAGLHAFEA